MFEEIKYRRMYRKFLGPLARPVSLLILNNGYYTSYNTKAHVSNYSESDLVPGGTIQLGDVRLIINREDLDAFGIMSMGLKDRINIGDKAYSVVHWDYYTRSVGSSTIAVEIGVRGGGNAVIASVSVYRITGQGDQRITANGDRRIIKEAV